MKYPEVKNYVGGRFVAGGHSFIDVFNPADGSVISRVPLSSRDDVDAAVTAARAAFPAWSQLPIKERVQVFFRYRTLLEKHIDELTALVTEENGKVHGEARAEILKSMELTEFACSLPQIATGEVLEVSRGVECRVDRYPVGVVASIVPNGPAAAIGLYADTGSRFETAATNGTREIGFAVIAPTWVCIAAVPVPAACDMASSASRTSWEVIVRVFGNPATRSRPLTSTLVSFSLG